MTSEEVKIRIYNFYKKTTLGGLSDWLAGHGYIKAKDEIYRDFSKYDHLDELGKNCLALGTNSNTEYPDGERLRIHNEFQSKQFKDLTNLDLDTLYFPKVCGFNGDEYGEFIIPPAAYRLGYYMSHMKKFCDKNDKQKKLIVEIGGGWGGLCNLALNNIPNANYVIVDTPTTIPTLAYFLHKCGKRICLPNEYEEFNDSLFSNYDCVMMLPEQLRLVTECDYLASTSCLPELNLEIIDYYVGEIKRILPKRFYVDFTHRCNGKYLSDKLNELSEVGYEKILHQQAPISCYVPWVKVPEWEKEAEEVEERIYEINRESTKGK